MKYIVTIVFLVFAWTHGQVFREAVLENWYMITPWYAMAHLIRFAAFNILLGLFVIKVWRDDG